MGLLDLFKKKKKFKVITSAIPLNSREEKLTKGFTYSEYNTLEEAEEMADILRHQTNVKVYIVED